ncbi:hypothetical protein ACHAXS_013281 [Conticribra weissflogii]
MVSPNHNSPRAAPQSRRPKLERSRNDRTPSPTSHNGISGTRGSHESNLINNLSLTTLISLPIVLCQFFFKILLSAFFLDRLFEKTGAESKNHNVEDPDGDNKSEENSEREITYEDLGVDPVPVPASPALTSLLDHALYNAYRAELVPTVCAATQLLQEFIKMKEAAALLLRECRWSVGVPLTGGLQVGGDNHEQWGELLDDVAVGYGNNDVFVGAGVVLDEDGNSALGINLEEGGTDIEAIVALEEAKWTEFETIQDFAQQCYINAKEAIQRLTTDKLAESANLTLEASVFAAGGMGESGATDSNGAVNDVFSGSQSSPLSNSSVLPTTRADIGIGRCYHNQPRGDCWESPRLYCPDYVWADDAIGGCQRLLRALSKHRFVSLVGLHGWSRYDNLLLEYSMTDIADVETIPAPVSATTTPHPFPSLEAIHALNYLVTHLLPKSIPAHLNQFRAAVESSTVITKRLYLVKCEYRAPIRANMEGWLALKAAPKIEMVKRYLKEYHSDISDNQNNGNGLRRKSSAASDGLGKSLQQQRENLEKLINENYWKHPVIVEALQLERCCEGAEAEMAQMLLPLANIAREIMNQRKGRIRAVAVVKREIDSEGGEENDEDEEDMTVVEILKWRDVPHMRELLRVSFSGVYRDDSHYNSALINLLSNHCRQRLKSILCRKPGEDESSGIRPLLLDLQGVPRHNQDPVDASIELPFFSLPSPERTILDRILQKNRTPVIPTDDQWFYLEQFLSGINTLLELLRQPGTPFLAEDRIIGNRNNKYVLDELAELCDEIWDEEMFRAQYLDWWDMVTRQHELSTGGAHAEIELSIAMASKEQLKMVLGRLQALRDDHESRFGIMSKIVNEVGQREMNENIIVTGSETNKTEYPELSIPGLFGKQLLMAGEVLPIG